MQNRTWAYLNLQHKVNITFAAIDSMSIAIVILEGKA
jgi:hypothetical protein